MKKKEGKRRKEQEIVKRTERIEEKQQNNADK